MFDPQQFLSATNPGKVGAMDVEEFVNRTREILEHALQGAGEHELIGMQCRLLGDAEIEREYVQLGAFNSITAARSRDARSKVREAFQRYIDDTDDLDARQIAQWQVEVFDVVEMTLAGEVA